MATKHVDGWKRRVARVVDLARTVEGQETDWLWRQAWARVLAHRGEHAEAEALAREAVAILERVDGLIWQGDGYLDLADVLASAGDVDKAVEAYGLALERYERKKNLAMVDQARQRLDNVKQNNFAIELLRKSQCVMKRLFRGLGEIDRHENFLETQNLWDQINDTLGFHKLSFHLPEFSTLCR